MSRIELALRQILADLADLEQPAALIGGLAVSVRTEPRFTRDIDLALAIDQDRAAEKLIASLRDRGYQVEAILEQEAVGRLATVRLVPPDEAYEGVVVDLLFASSGLEPEVVDAADLIQVFPDLAVPVATVPHLIALKILSRDDLKRPQDIADIRSLLGVAELSEIEVSRSAIQMIIDRGYHRDRQLMQELESVLREQEA